MFQSPHLSVNPRFTVEKIIREPLLYNFRHLTKADILLRVKYWMDILELPYGYLEKNPQQLSGGELQRVVLARTLVMEPEFIILDEPFSYLDEDTAGHLIDFLSGLFRSFGTGVLFISHNPDYIDAWADVVLTL